ncbi:hypothetical protein OIU77_017803 [Salix suchowensis]|uniref:Glycine-rich protein n=1 Tax=Salix suchowensis TaxID=1278906 RepID=A0ABQ8ZQG5_9ROSI|nr:hypothetical protein OIU77_017803 [Salix suchowensis]
MSPRQQSADSKIKSKLGFLNLNFKLKLTQHLFREFGMGVFFELSASENAAASGSSGPRPTRATYILPHLRNQPPSSAFLAPPPAAPSLGNDHVGYSGPVGGYRWGGGGSRPDHGRSGHGSGGREGGGWNNRSGGWDRGREREVNPFGDVEPACGEQENTGINFDAYEDIPVETSGHNVPPPVNTFAEIDLGT